MKTSILAVVLTCGLSASLASAQDRPAPGQSEMNMEMGKPPSQSASGAPAMNPAMDTQSPKMPPSMEKMQQQMEKIRAATDPTERQKLMQEHMQTMKENMKAMRDMGRMGGMGGMGGAAMKGAGKPGEMGMGDKKPSMQDGEMKKRQDMAETRLDMMQMMMEQMMQREEAMKPMPHQ